MSPDRTRRRVILAMFVRRSVHALRAQRERLLAPDHPAAFDLDFYAYAAWQLREAVRQGATRLALADLTPILRDLDAGLPYLKTYRDVMTHAVDDGIDGWFWFSTDVVRQVSQDTMEYLIDARENHAFLEDVAAQAISVLDPTGSIDGKWGPLADGRP